MGPLTREGIMSEDNLYIIMDQINFKRATAIGEVSLYE